MEDQVASTTRSPGPPGRTTLMLLLLPLLLLGAVIAVFVTTSGGLTVEPAAPINKLDIERKVVTAGGFDLYIRNVGPRDLTIAQVVVNDAIWPARVEPGPTLSRLSNGVIHIPFGWVRGEAYEIKLVTSDSIVITTEIPVAFETPTPEIATFASFTLIGLYVGVIPIFLGLLWAPALRRIGRRGMVFLLALTIGLLIFLGVDAVNEAVEQASAVAGPFQGIGLVGLGLVLTVLLLEAIGRRQASTGRGDSERRLAVATMIALGIGLHNLGEGLAIGAAYAVGEVAFGAFLVVGFIIQNITEGLAIVAPVARDRPSVGRLALLGLLGGAPAILGTWIGGLTHFQPLSVVFLAIGAGAVFQVAWEIGRLVRTEEAKTAAPLLRFGGIAAGMLVLYATGVLIK